MERYLAQAAQGSNALRPKDKSGVSNQSFATDKVLPSPEIAPRGNDQNSFGGEGALSS